jgi:hypothetical protein
MSQTNHSEPSTEARQVPADVAQSLFWDDVRGGLKLVSVGLILLLVGELCIQFHLHEFLSGAAIIAGGLICLLGLGICTAVPQESGARPVAVLAAVCGGLGLLALLVDLFNLFYQPVLGAFAVALGAVSLVLFAIFLLRCAAYLGHRPLLAGARSFSMVAPVFAFLMLMVALTGLGEAPAARALVGILAIGVVANAVYLAWETAAGILRVRQGAPLEAARRLPPTAEELAAEQKRLARENITYKPSPPPHFSGDEVRFFRADDSRAGGAIVVLMAGIFFAGVVLYTIVAWSVAL